MNAHNLNKNIVKKKIQSQDSFGNKQNIYIYNTDKYKIIVEYFKGASINLDFQMENFKISIKNGKNNFMSKINNISEKVFMV